MIKLVVVGIVIERDTPWLAAFLLKLRISFCIFGCVFLVLSGCSPRQFYVEVVLLCVFFLFSFCLLIVLFCEGIGWLRVLVMVVSCILALGIAILIYGFSVSWFAGNWFLYLVTCAWFDRLTTYYLLRFIVLDGIQGLECI